MSYLKAVGVLRLVAEQADEDVRGCWCDGGFVLHTKLDEDALIRFFLERYRPTPIIAPWAGGSGFFGSDNRLALDAICDSKSDRLIAFASLIHRTRDLLARLGIKSKPSAHAKDELLRRYRREMPDEFVEWMDTALVLEKGGQSFPPLLGTGGNDGRLDFTQNYMQRLVSLGFAGSQLAANAGALLRQTLFGEPARDLLSAAVGQFDPGRAGGPNATVGMEGQPLVDPWDFVLMLESTLILAGAAARRLGAGQRDRAAFPFTVRPSAVGYASEAQGEEADARGEIWLPIWESPASLAELRLVFAEGRADSHGRQSRDGVDFARAVAGLGTDRGIAAFVRYGFLKRSGKAFVATPLGTFPVRARRSADLLRDVDVLVDTLKRLSTGKDAPARFRFARHRVEAAIFNYCRYAQGEEDASWLQPVLAALGGAERELALGDSAPEKRRARRPLAGLSPEWLAAANDNSPEYRLALSLACLSGDPSKSGPIRRYLEPVEWKNGAWLWTARGGYVVWSGGDLARNLGAILVRRVMDAEKAGENPLPLGGYLAASLADIIAFQLRHTDDQKMEDLVWGMMLTRAGAFTTPRRQSDARDSLSRSYAILKLTLLPGRLSWAQYNSKPVLRLSTRDEDDATSSVAVKPEPAIFTKLEAGSVGEACEIASRRLQASGLLPLARLRGDGSRRAPEWSASGIEPARLLASLLFPISGRSVNDLAHAVLRQPAQTPVA
jgi:CRISPR-associated protein Csx17